MADSPESVHRTGGSSDPSAPSPLPPAPQPAARTIVHEPLARDVERLLRQQGVADDLRPVVGRDGGHLRLEVTPDGMGPIEVRVAVRADAVHASLVAPHDQTREALEAHRPTLEAALGRTNLRLEGFTVGLGQHQRGEQGASAEDGRRSRGANASLAISPVAAAPLADGPRAASGLSLRA